MFNNPIQNLKAFGLREADIVADLGAGTGFYAIPAADMVPEGKVYAIELHRDYLTTIKHKIHDTKNGNVEPILGDVEKNGGSQIADQIVDKVIAANIFSQVEHKDKFIEEMSRILKKGGEVLFVDWSPDSHIFQSHKSVSEKEVKKILEEAGFVYERKVDAGVHHYGMILKKV